MTNHPHLPRHPARAVTVQGMQMNWSTIEAKWAEMARRVGSHLPSGGVPGREQDPPTTPPGDLPEPPYPEAAIR